MRKEFEKRIKRKQLDRLRVEGQIITMNAELSAIDAVIAELESLMRMMPREGGMESAISHAKEIRFGTEVYHAREALEAAGKPLYVGEILKIQGKDDSKGPRSSLASQLGTYAREGRIFTKEGPNIFGLVDFNIRSEPETEPEDDHGLGTGDDMDEVWAEIEKMRANTAPPPPRPLAPVGADEDIPF